MDIQTRTVLRVNQRSELGSVSLAGFIKKSPGISLSSLRVLGQYALVYIINGKGRYVDARGIDQTVRAGDLLTIYPDIAHGYGSGWDELYVVFSGEVFDLWRARRVLDDQKPVAHLEPIEHWVRKFETLFLQLSRDSSSVTSICRLQTLLAEILDDSCRQAGSDPDQDWLQKVMKAIDQASLHSQPNWETLAHRFSMSYAGFRRKFTRVSGQPPARYLAHQVINRAAALIRDRRLTNKQVASACGFHDEFHFSKRFKSMIGLTPREFRRFLDRSPDDVLPTSK